MVIEQGVKIVELDRAQVIERQDDLVNVYRDAFTPPPYEKGENVVRQFHSTLDRHVKNEGFRCVAAMVAASGRFCGFGYGYTSRKGQWWHDQVVRQLDARTVDLWFSDAFEIVELALQPQMQGLGIGGRLHDRLLEPVPHCTAVLSTLDAETRGLHLYQNRGWRIIRNGFIFSGVREPYLIMGLRLKGDGAP